MAKLKRLLPQVTVLVLLGGLIVALGAASSEPAVELTVRARQMAFYVDGNSQPNPTLVLPAGRRVRLTFVNEDRGLEHDLVLEGLGRRSGVLAGDGSSEVLVFRTPASPSTTAYSCSLHLAMMQAALEVR